MTEDKLSEETVVWTSGKLLALVEASRDVAQVHVWIEGLRLSGVDVPDEIDSALNAIQTALRALGGDDVTDNDRLGGTIMEALKRGSEVVLAPKPGKRYPIEAAVGGETGRVSEFSAHAISKLVDELMREDEDAGGWPVSDASPLESTTSHSEVWLVTCMADEGVLKTARKSAGNPSFHLNCQGTGIITRECRWCKFLSTSVIYTVEGEDDGRA